MKYFTSNSIWFEKAYQSHSPNLKTASFWWKQPRKLQSFTIEIHKSVNSFANWWFWDYNFTCFQCFWHSFQLLMGHLSTKFDAVFTPIQVLVRINSYSSFANSSLLIRICIFLKGHLVSYTHHVPTILLYLASLLYLQNVYYLIKHFWSSRITLTHFFALNRQLQCYVMKWR